MQRKLYPNVDFSGIVQRAIGIPTSLFTGIFALARTVKLDRPAQRMLARTPVQDRPPASALHRLGAPYDVKPLEQR